LVISGIAGIGKTTLAEILAYEHLSKGYEFVEITENIEEAWRLINPEIKQLFYYDDFLGRTNNSEKLGKNEDHSIISFIKEIHKSKNKRFILTTRTQLLSQAKLSYEPLSDQTLDLAKCVVDLENYTHLIRAKILYNHLYFSDIADSYKIELLKNNCYKQIINHANFTPRIIEAMVYSNLQLGKPSEYAKLFVESLDKPYKIWDYPFNNQISQSSRYLLAMMLTLTKSTNLSELKTLFLKSSNFTQRDFMYSCKELDGCFIKESKSFNNIYTFIEFHNPSIVDYLQDYISDTGEFIEDLIANSMHMSQLLRLWGAPFISSSAIRLAIVKNPEIFISAIQKLIFSPCGKTSNILNSYYEERALLLLDVYDNTKNDIAKKLLMQLMQELDVTNINDGEELLSFIEWCQILDCFSEYEKNQLIHSAKRVLIIESTQPNSSMASMKNIVCFLSNNDSFATKEEKLLLRNTYYNNYEGYYDEIYDLDYTEELEEFLSEMQEIAKYLAIEA